MSLDKKINEDTIKSYDYYDKILNISIDGGGEDGHYIEISLGDRDGKFDTLSRTYLPSQNESV